MLNKVTLIGNVGADPEVRSTNNGDRIANIRLATSERWRDRNSGERKEKTEWHRVVIFNEHLVKVVEEYVKKGSTIYVEGSIQTRKWTDNAGVEKYSTEIVLQKFKGELVLLGGKGERSDAGDDERGFTGGGQRQRPTGPRETFSADLDDEIPF